MTAGPVQPPGRAPEEVVPPATTGRPAGPADALLVVRVWFDGPRSPATFRARIIRSVRSPSSGESVVVTSTEAARRVVADWLDACLAGPR